MDKLSEQAAQAKATMFESMMSNNMFAAGAGMTGLLGCLAVCRTGLQRGATLAQRYFTVSLEIPSKDRSYQWVLQWISKHKIRTHHLGVETQFKQSESGHVSTRFDFVPSPGQHWITYRGNFIRVLRSRNENMIDLQSGSPWETVQLTAVGRNPKIFTDLLGEARQEALQREEGKTIIYSSMGPEWRPFGRPRRRRPLDSVILDSGISEKIISDVGEFANSSKWYLDRGIPYRRGYLLHGPPGCGKSSFITALAGQLEYNICILNLFERGLTDDKLNALFAVTPPRSIILLEDIDAAFVQRDAKQNNFGVTFSGLLNTLDGVASTEERIVFMTTNHVDRLDPALLRPGRVDVQLEVSYATPHQVAKMFRRFYPDHADLTEEFVFHVRDLLKARRDRTGSIGISVAQLQSYFLTHKFDPKACMQQLKRETERYLVHEPAQDDNADSS
eukprot:gb/GEZN01006340.1/.p1 GENE.gb/GEZN01006340.1/~~gb/GEZN01006340.1/.p1  ORF type:complete len:446 (-),score=44.22 gb/GEZN01006340.1/:312-1649(-)